MARQVLGGLATLNLATNLDPMFAELYAGLGGDFTSVSAFNLGNGTGVRTLNINSGNTGLEGGALVFKRAGSNTFAIGDGGAVAGTGASDTLLYTYGANNLRLYTNGVEGARITASGNLLVGSTTGTTRLYAAASNPANGYVATFSNTYATSGRTGTFTVYDASGLTGWAVGIPPDDGSFVFRDLVANAIRLRVSGIGNLQPGADNVSSLGISGTRWSVVFAATGAINTSDAREKTKVAPLNEQELKCAIQLSKEIGLFQYLTAREEKGEKARIHCGMTVQRVMHVMESYGLVPRRYAFICYDEWEAVEHSAQYREEQRGTGIFDTDGREITETIKILTSESHTTPAGNRYGFRMDQLALFIARGQAQRQEDLEARIEALEQ